MEYQRNHNNVSLPANRAFVVQFHPATEDGQVCCAGRVEHLISGEASHFASLDELWRFITHVLLDV